MYYRLVSLQYPLVYDCRCCPDPKTRYKDDCKRHLFLETEESHKEKEDAGHDAPKSALGKVLHDLRVALVFYIHPHEYKGAGEWHNPDEARS